MLGDNSVSVSSVSAYLSKKASNAFWSKLSFQGHLFSEQLQKTEIVSPSGDKDGIFNLKLWKIKMVSLKTLEDKRQSFSRTKSKNAYCPQKRFRFPKFKVPFL